jgi:predicted outer membrane protein
MLLALMLACGLLAVPVAAAQAGSSGGDDRCFGFDDSTCTISAATYLPLAAQSNQFEITTGQLAQQRGESTTVRDLGAMLVQDHTALLEQITTLAATLNITLPTGLDAQQQALVDQLGQLSGADFDRAWLRIQWRVHKQALLLNLRAAVCGETPEIRTLAQGALPVITRHLAELRLALQALAGDDDDGNGNHGNGHNGNCDHSHKHHGRGHAYGHRKACVDRHGNEHHHHH